MDNQAPWAPCNCIADNEAKIVEHINKTKPELTLTDRGSFLHKAYFFNLGKYGMYHEFKYESQFKKVNGEMSKPKSTTVSIYPNYCGFCGNALSDPTEKETGKEIESHV